MWGTRVRKANMVHFCGIFKHKLQIIPDIRDWVRSNPRPCSGVRQQVQLQMDVVLWPPGLKLGRPGKVNASMFNLDLAVGLDFAAGFDFAAGLIFATVLVMYSLVCSGNISTFLCVRTGFCSGL